MNLEIGGIGDLKRLYDRHNGRLNAPFELVREALSDWNVWVLHDNGPKAIVIEKDGSAHIAGYDSENVGIARMKWAIDELKINRTSVSDDFRKGHALARRLGFHVEMTEKGVTHYVRRT